MEPPEGGGVAAIRAARAEALQAALAQMWQPVRCRHWPLTAVVTIPPIPQQRRGAAGRQLTLAACGDAAAAQRTTAGVDRPTACTITPHGAASAQGENSSARDSKQKLRYRSSAEEESRSGSAAAARQQRDGLQALSPYGGRGGCSVQLP
ncbi:hypothetical protein VaNZ11_005524 [Volvox africanus]|uniref:Uncharacterized protein n=1 Tax=Volvox africanus TaxID=51714 RepID=A0ABQ5RYS1_9CHLO|nr:hypothetical protein VaNZ11_005524 [Volvox africanus]